jgi:hypothetical protein
MFKKISLVALVACIANPALAAKSLCMFGKMGDHPLMLVEYNATTVTIQSEMFPALSGVNLPRDNDRTAVGAGTTSPLGGNNYILVLRATTATLIVEGSDGATKQWKGTCSKV